jgi:hypothetical protein
VYCIPALHLEINGRAMQRRQTLADSRGHCCRRWKRD